MESSLEMSGLMLDPIAASGFSVTSAGVGRTFTDTLSKSFCRRKHVS